LFPATEGNRSAGDLDPVDRDHAVVEGTTEAHLAGTVCGHDIGNEAVFAVIGAAHHFVFGVEGGHGGNRSESLLAHDGGGVRYIDEERRFEEQRSSGMAIAARYQMGAAVERVRHLGFDLED